MESAVRLYAWNLSYAKALVEDLSGSQVTRSAGPGLENHPAWTIGHLVTGSDILAVSHEAMHLGQLAAWRRAQGLPSALATL